MPDAGNQMARFGRREGAFEVLERGAVVPSIGERLADVEGHSELGLAVDFAACGQLRVEQLQRAARMFEGVSEPSLVPRADRQGVEGGDLERGIAGAIRYGEYAIQVSPGRIVISRFDVDVADRAKAQPFEVGAIGVTREHRAALEH